MIYVCLKLKTRFSQEHASLIGKRPLGMEYTLILTAVKYAALPRWSPNPEGREVSAESQGPHTRRNAPSLGRPRMCFGESAFLRKPTWSFRGSRE